ncbi:hypothetical protein RM549_15830 [Salegentibacter sp. F188]|uniref:Transmembrane protein n=1 Tax=Autumnicola patrickiae TaxID=3075591 RepID=A0ABU3E5I8_9FLAO|nr:hypothetical protein [Salegentibacter sp. F188]MDT0691266.1 hypothetical protein [Salegentibacter sp. F188]
MFLVKKVAYILSFIFFVFIATPIVVVCIDKTVDISAAFLANEEESSSGNNFFEFNFEENHHSNYESIHFLQELKVVDHYFHMKYHNVFLEVVSPPPKLA